MISPKVFEILKRKKQAIRLKYNSLDGCPESALEFELLLQCAQADIPVKYWDYTLNDLNQANIPIRDKLMKYCLNFDKVLNEGLGLFLVGANGNGKTMSACLILKEALRQNKTARFITLNQIVAMASDGTYNADIRKAFEEQITQVDFLVIDDITKIYKNTQKTQSTYVDTQLDHVLRARCNLNLPTIITSNHSKEETFKSADEVLTNSFLSLFQEHFTEIFFLGKDRRADP